MSLTIEGAAESIGKFLGNSKVTGQLGAGIHGTGTHLLRPCIPGCRTRDDYVSVFRVQFSAVVTHAVHVVVFILRNLSTLIVVGYFVIVGAVTVLTSTGIHLLVCIVQQRCRIFIQSLIPGHIALVAIQAVTERTRRYLFVIHLPELIHNGFVHLCGARIETVFYLGIGTHFFPSTASQYEAVLLDYQGGIGVAVPALDSACYQTALHDIGAPDGIGTSHKSAQSLRAVGLDNLC